jgi:hypothetical protein
MICDSHLQIFGCYPAMGGHPLWPEELSVDENQLDVWNRHRNDSTVLSDLTSGESKFQSVTVLGKNENL